ncbi:hypothetical protein X798_04304 [Onchocerca flexuosa]|uniref:Uncharacterized protein n=1 Tax=Onchocerca flexuosa TaxID=387005 RepID=A0A238BTJ1_9BILA|nr:hypothetical protein X798_04304 [Onchocerca flexuosa]
MNYRTGRRADGRPSGLEGREYRQTFHPFFSNETERSRKGKKVIHILRPFRLARKLESDEQQNSDFRGNGANQLIPSSI